jgi:hypothetical protein
VQKALVLLGLLTVAGSAHAADGPLPPPAFTARADLAALTASGPTTALATVKRGRCVVRFLRLGTGAGPGLLRPPSPCGGPDSEAVIDDLWLGRSGIAAETYDSPSPHGEAFAYLAGPRPAGPLRVRGEWSWTDSQPPWGFGCAWAVSAGGGVIAAAATPHRLGWDHGMEQESPSCPSRGSTTVELSGAPGARLVVPGVHAPLATDGKRVLLAELDENGARTGQVSLLDLAGKPLPAPRVDPALVKIAYAVWLTRDGLVIASKKGIQGAGWSAPRAGAATVGLGRVVYQVGRQLHVHRVKGGPDRLLLMLPRGRTLLAAGSTGVAIATDDDTAVRLYRLPWRTIDRTLTA